MRDPALPVFVRGHRCYVVYLLSKKPNSFKATLLLQSTSVAGVILQPSANVSPNFSLEDASTMYQFSFQYMPPWPRLSAFPHFPLSLPTSFCSSGPLQLAMDSIYQGILVVAEPQGQPGIWRHSLTNSPSPPLPFSVTIWLLCLPTNPAALPPAWGSSCF